MNTKSKTIAQMAAALADNPKIEQGVRDEITRSSMVSCLLSMRVSKGVTQEQVAEAMHCDPSKISRLESGNDLSLKWTDIVCYAGALNLGMSVFFDDPTLPAADRIKQCVFSIREHLDKLTELAGQVGGNDKIAKKINEFSGEVLFNFLMQYKGHSEQLRSVIKIAPHAQVKEALAACEMPLIEGAAAAEKVVT